MNRIFPIIADSTLKAFDWMRDLAPTKQQPYASGNIKVHHGDENRKRKRKHGKH